MIDRRDEFREHGERLLDEAKRHKDQNTIIAAALCAMAWNQLTFAQDWSQPLVDTSDPWEAWRALGADPPCSHEPDAFGTCKLCGWSVVTGWDE